MAFSRNFTDAPSSHAEPLKEFWQLAQTKVLKQTSIEQGSCSSKAQSDLLIFSFYPVDLLDPISFVVDDYSDPFV